MMNSKRNTKNRTFAIVAAVPAMTPKPNTPAINAIIKNVNAQLNMIHPEVRRNGIVPAPTEHVAV